MKATCHEDGTQIVLELELTDTSVTLEARLHAYFGELNVTHASQDMYFQDVQIRFPAAASSRLAQDAHNKCFQEDVHVSE